MNSEFNFPNGLNSEEREGIPAPYLLFALITQLYYVFKCTTNFHT